MAATRSDFYPRPPRGGRPGPFRWPFSTPGISIHALREEGDRCSGQAAGPAADFYPRPPRGGRRLNGKTQILPLKFLSTPSARRATLCAGVCGVGEAISIHALREEGDLLLGRRLLLGRISIHALREEGDTRTLPRCSSWAYFYPRPPRGGRLRSFRSLRLLGPFLSTPSARRATSAWRGEGAVRLISIHALREEGDTSKRRRSRTTCNFYPRPPRGGRQSPCVAFCVFRIFLSTPSARRATDFLLQLGICLLISIHALREEGDPSARPGRPGPYEISIHALREEGDTITATTQLKS